MAALTTIQMASQAPLNACVIEFNTITMNVIMCFSSILVYVAVWVILFSNIVIALYKKSISLCLLYQMEDVRLQIQFATKIMWFRDKKSAVVCFECLFELVDPKSISFCIKYKKLIYRFIKYIAC